MKKSNSILCIGPEWRGSNAGALFKALGRIGNFISVVDEFYYLPLRANTKISKVIAKLFRPVFIKSYNKAILFRYNLVKPDIVLIYKGAFVYPETVMYMKQNTKVVCFYPDVSFHTHGSYLQKTLPLYEKVFTTKTFGIKDMKEQLGQKNGVFVPHGFDPDIHRKINISEQLRKQFSCDASFIGTWSPHKEEYLTYVVQKLPQLNLKIWGGQWDKAGNMLKPYIQNTEILGDFYAMAIQCSKINIALLSEKVKGASYGDKITSRTFHIPASGGFMLHQDSEEIGNYYDLEKEISVFTSKENLVFKISYFLQDSQKRLTVSDAGYLRATEDHSLINRAHLVMENLKD